MRIEDFVGKGEMSAVNQLGDVYVGKRGWDWGESHEDPRAQNLRRLALRCHLCLCRILSQVFLLRSQLGLGVGRPVSSCFAYSQDCSESSLKRDWRPWALHETVQIELIQTEKMCNLDSGNGVLL